MEAKHDFIPTIVIVLISTFAFSIGYYQIQVNQILSDKTDQMNQYQYKYDISDKYTKNIVQIDDQYITYSLNALEEAYQLSVQFLIQNSTFTPLQRSTSLLEIGLRINKSMDWIYQSKAYEFAVYFAVNPSDYYCYLLNQTQSGFNLAINRTEFYANYPIEFQNTTSFLVNYGYFNQSFVNELFKNPSVSPDSYYPVYYIKYLQYIFWDTIDVFLSHINSLENDIQYYSNLSNYLLLSVSISTLATVLSATISDRKDNRENELEFASLRSAFYNDPHLELSLRDKLSSLLLVVALVASVIGVLMPLLLPRIGG